jgi:porphyrinogen peroxidase
MPSTPGDLLFHIRAKRMDLCFELATQIMARLGDAVSPPTRCTASATSTTAISSASSTAPRIPGARPRSTPLIGDEDAAFAGGSYVIVQKYLHDLAAWNALSTEAQERIIGRTKLSDIELDDSVKPTSRTTR